MTPPPLVSVVVPVSNGERHLADALDSILTQSLHQLELVVVDDGSTDGSVEIVRRISDARCRLLRQPRGGAPAARNLGVAASTGALLAFLDADDVWTTDAIERRTRALGDDPGLDMVFGHYSSIGVGGEAREADEPRPGYSLGTMLIRRQRFLDVGPLATRWRVGEFIDWYARAEDMGLRHAMLPDVLLRRRVHDTNLTARANGNRTDYARVVRAVAARRARLRNHGA